MTSIIKRKVLQSGSSKVVALPPDWTRAYKIDIGDSVEVLYGSLVVIKPQNQILDVELLRKELNLLEETNTKTMEAS